MVSRPFLLSLFFFPQLHGTVLERFFSRQDRQDLFRSWAGSASMWIKGGDAIWGSATRAPDDPLDATHTHGELIAFRDFPSPPKNVTKEAEQSSGNGSIPILNNIYDPGPLSNMTANEAGAWILHNTPSSFQKMIATNYSFGMEKDEAQLKRNNLDHTKWSNPLEVM
jgi:phospholipid:diacylglycerol acyltransferase